MTVYFRWLIYIYILSDIGFLEIGLDMTLLMKFVIAGTLHPRGIMT